MIIDHECSGDLRSLLHGGRGPLSEKERLALVALLEKCWGHEYVRGYLVGFRFRLNATHWQTDSLQELDKLSALLPLDVRGRLEHREWLEKNKTTSLGLQPEHLAGWHSIDLTLCNLGDRALHNTLGGSIQRTIDMLCLRATQITSEGLRTALDAFEPSTLDVSGNSLGDAWLEASHATSIQSLILTSTELTARGVSHLLRQPFLQGLRHLDVSGNDLEGLCSHTTLTGHRAVTKLVAWKCNLDDTDAHALVNSFTGAELRELDLSHNELSTHAVTSILSEIPTLQALYVSGMGLDADQLQDHVRRSGSSTTIIC